VTFRLLAISPGPPDSRWLPKLVQLLPLGDRLAFLYRDTSSNARTYFQHAQQLAKLCQPAHIAFFVHRRLDMALSLNAHLHLPSGGLSPSQARPMLPPHHLISVSVHNDEEAKLAHGANFALISPVFPAGSKPGDLRPPLGPEGFLRLAHLLPCPAWAMGGINPSRLQQIPRLAGAAAVSAFWQSDDPLQTAKALLACWDKHST
jgi:thiamine-phosphate pyrophosphorylase